MSNDLGNWGGGASCLSLLSGGLMCLDANIILFDVNGYSKPNKRGEDIFLQYGIRKTMSSDLQKVIMMVGELRMEY